MEIYVRKNVILLEQNMLVNYQPMKFYTVAFKLPILTTKCNTRNHHIVKFNFITRDKININIL